MRGIETAEWTRKKKERLKKGARGGQTRAEKREDGERKKN